MGLYLLIGWITILIVSIWQKWLWVGEYPNLEPNLMLLNFLLLSFIGMCAYIANERGGGKKRKW